MANRCLENGPGYYLSWKAVSNLICTFVYKAFHVLYLIWFSQLPCEITDRAGRNDWENEIWEKPVYFLTGAYFSKADFWTQEVECELENSCQIQLLISWLSSLWRGQVFLFRTPQFLPCHIFSFYYNSQLLHCEDGFIIKMRAIQSI